MKQIFSAANLACIIAGIGFLSLLSACASTETSDTGAVPQKVASANCETVQPALGSNLSHRVCTPKAAAQPGDAATPQ